MKKISQKKNIMLTVVICIFILIFIIVVAYPVYSRFIFNRKTVKMIRDASYVKLYVYDNDNIITNADGAVSRKYKIYKTSDKEIIQKIWKSIEYILNTPEKPYENTTFDEKRLALIGYDAEIIYTGEGTAEYPIAVYTNGESHWGLAPDRDATHYTPVLRDCIIEIIEKDIEDRFELLEEKIEYISIPLEENHPMFLDSNDISIQHF